MSSQHNINGEAWARIRSTIPAPASLRNMPTVVSNFYLLAEVMFKTPFCPSHMEAMLTTYVEILTPQEFSEIDWFCNRYLIFSFHNLAPFGSILGKPLRWIGVLQSKFPLEPSDIPAESVQMLVNDQRVVGCAECRKLSGLTGLEDLMARLGL